MGIKKGLTQRVEDSLYGMISAGERFQAGDKLPNENELSQELGVSRSTLREAIRSLVVQGILEVHRGKGTYVTGVFRVHEKNNVISLERVRGQLRELFEIRLLLEPDTGALAAQNATEAELENILRLGRRVREILESDLKNEVGSTSFEEWASTDQAFHTAIILASHNSCLNNLVPLIHRSINESLLLVSQRDRMADFTIKDHALIMEFLSSRVPAGVRHAMSVHIRHAMRSLNI